MTEAEFFLLAHSFLKNMFNDLRDNNIQLAQHWDIDHICFRSESNVSYAELKSDFSHFAQLLIESDVNGRPIATFKLNKPIEYDGWRIDLVELPAPKQGKVTPSGFEHIEIVCDAPFDELKKRYEHLKIDVKGLEKDFNQELEVCLGERNVKFHHCSLSSVIQVEKNHQVWNAIQDSKILSLFKVNDPLVVGTIPLGVDTPDSDLDIILCSNDLLKMEEMLKLHFGQCEEFEIFQYRCEGQDSLVCRFRWSSITFEIFAQSIDTVRQTAFRHFQVEERLLKIGGINFLEKIKAERTRGLKTEPAFAKILKIQEDPYLALLELQQMSQIDIGVKFFVPTP